VKGRSSEASAFTYLAQQGYKPLAHNLRLFHTEIDALFLSPDGELIILEVKTQHYDPSWQPVISDRQRLRLRGVLETLTACAFGPVRAHLIMVSDPGSGPCFQLIPDFLL
jgi:Holliday junction resolvase-like predicted endonuclease